ncbi:glycerophosphodiester phosphodiesterase family protein [Paludicola sp. MB14-C6]|uniref:glycerophosphodiester phosphodiesterase family protein n=1 Tax=Paludihabitans sp. MB14-C6 TaxID=3070656 RepID=UPI0027DBF740|nr:glycerophosphodiester phosphodiesterase family protein [Paludicola sp. MB14-C6]WMJ23514.1 glycerophosphodiester phosphodiesterase family protein [Paludicola sp. MB14-C6]
MAYVYTIIIILIILFVLYLYLIAPKKSSQAIEKFRNVHLAHRGLHGDGVPENSMKAFSLAVESGFGIELDVHKTLDDKVVVIHDSNTMRVCGVEKMIEESTYEELCELSLENTEEKIPLFKDVLTLVNGKVPLLVELKSKGSEIISCPYVVELLDSYNGDYCIESFNPLIVAWFKKNRPDIVRGQLSSKIKTVGKDTFKDKLLGFMITNLMTNFMAKPNFIAYDYRYISNLSFKLCKTIFKAPIFLWTLKGKEVQDKFEGKYFGYIFEK